MAGRVIAAAATDLTNWKMAFLVFALLNLLGAALLQLVLPESQAVENRGSPLNSLRTLLGSIALCGAFAVGYLILFVFVGVFTYVNFRLAQPPFGLSARAIGLVYLVFAPSLFVTLAVGAAVRRFGYRIAFIAGASLSLLGASLTMAAVLPLVLLGLALVAAGMFFAQAVATAFTGHVASSAKGAASGLYLAAYYAGGLCGAWFMGTAFGVFGWLGCAALAAGGSGLTAIVAAATWSSGPRSSRFGRRKPWLSPELRPLSHARRAVPKSEECRQDEIFYSKCELPHTPRPITSTMLPRGWTVYLGNVGVTTSGAECERRCRGWAAIGRVSRDQGPSLPARNTPTTREQND
jgi:hypothetical protein